MTFKLGRYFYLVALALLATGGASDNPASKNANGESLRLFFKAMEIPWEAYKK
jgi:hypothetical protein